MSQLKPNCLSYTELLAQAVALISPTMTAALIVPVMYSNTVLRPALWVVGR